MQVNSYLNFVNKLTEAETQRIIKLYSDAEKQILTLINSGLLNPYQIGFLKNKLSEADKILDYLNQGSKQWTQEMTTGLYGAGVKFADLSIGVVTNPDILASRFHLEAMNVLANNVYGRLGELTGVVGRRINDIYRSIALESIKSNIAGYDSLSKIAQNMRDNLAKQGITGFVDKAGKEWNMTSYTDMVARTSTMETFRQGTANEYLENDIDLVQINNVITPTTCEVCRKYAGKIISLTGKTEGYPTLEEVTVEGMFHSNCIHSYHVVIPDTETLRKENDRLQKIYEGT
jgi:hypothetical protein